MCCRPAAHRTSQNSQAEPLYRGPGKPTDGFAPRKDPQHYGLGTLGLMKKRQPLFGLMNGSIGELIQLRPWNLIKRYRFEAQAHLKKPPNRG